MLTTEIINETLSPWQQTFQIAYDGTSHTDPNNKGIFGFFVERLFGILPNKSREPDLYGVEIKCVGLNERNSAKEISVSIITQAEHLKVCTDTTLDFAQSHPQQKMSQCLYVFYRRNKDVNGDLWFEIDSWNFVDMSNLSHQDQQQFDYDYKILAGWLQSKDYTWLREMQGQPNKLTKYLKLGYKGKTDRHTGKKHNQPCWKFSAKWLQKVQQDGYKHKSKTVYASQTHTSAAQWPDLRSDLPLRAPGFENLFICLP